MTHRADPFFLSGLFNKFQIYISVFDSIDVYLKPKKETEALVIHSQIFIIIYEILTLVSLFCC